MLDRDVNTVPFYILLIDLVAPTATLGRMPESWHIAHPRHWAKGQPVGKEEGLSSGRVSPEIAGGGLVPKSGT